MRPAKVGLHWEVAFLDGNHRTPGEGELTPCARCSRRLVTLPSPTAPAHWSAPLSAHRVDPTANIHQVAVTQIRALLHHRSHPGEIPIFVFDAGYDAIQLAQLLGDLPVGLLVRLRSNRCFYAKPAPRIRPYACNSSRTASP